MDDAGNILIRRYSKANVYIKSTASAPNEETAIGNDIMKLPNQALEMEKIVKVSRLNLFCIHENINKTINVQFRKLIMFPLVCCHVAVVRHEEVPIEREPGTEACLSRPKTAGDSMPVRGGVCQV